MTAQIVHLTDPHLLCDDEATLKGVNTTNTLRKLLRSLQLRFRDSENKPDAVIITGDLAQDEQRATYQMLREILDEHLGELFGDWLPCCRLVPGNHDQPELIRQVFPECVGDAPDGGNFSETSKQTAPVSFSMEVGGWRLIGLDTHSPGEVAGAIDDNQLDWLSRELQHHAEQPAILFMHHPPFPVGTSWVDAKGLRDPQRLWDVIEPFSQVRVLCAGHVHHEYHGRRGGLELFTTPSTAFQFQAGAPAPVIDSAPTGYRIFHLDGESWRTSVVRLAEP